MEFLAEVILELTENEKFEENARLKIFYAYLSNDELKNKYNSLHFMMKAEDSKSHNLRDEFCIYRFK